MQKDFQKWLEGEKAGLEKCFPSLLSEQKHALYLILYTAYLQGSLYSAKNYNERLEKLAGKIRV